MTPSMPSRNSTNVRYEIALTLGLWAGAVAMASTEDVLAKLSAAELAALMLFAVAYAPAAYLLDRELRDEPWDLRTLAIAIAMLDIVLAFAGFRATASDEAWPLLLATPPFAIAGLVLLPVAIALHVALVDRARRRRKSGQLLGSHLARARP